MDINEEYSTIVEWVLLEKPTVEQALERFGQQKHLDELYDNLRKMPKESWDSYVSSLLNGWFDHLLSVEDFKRLALYCTWLLNRSNYTLNAELSDKGILVGVSDSGEFPKVFVKESEISDFYSPSRVFYNPTSTIIAGFTQLIVVGETIYDALYMECWVHTPALLSKVTEMRSYWEFVTDEDKYGFDTFLDSIRAAAKCEDEDEKALFFYHIAPNAVVKILKHPVSDDLRRALEKYCDTQTKIRGFI